MTTDADADLAPLLEAKAELEAAMQPTETPKPTEEPQDDAPKAEAEVTDQPTQDEPTGEGESPAEAEPAPGPDLSWLPEDEREAFKALPEPAKNTLQRIRKGVLKGLNKAQQDAAAAKKDAEFARNLATPEERAAYFAWKRERLTGSQPTEKPATKAAPKSKLDEILGGDPELVAALREEIATLGGQKAREVVSEPQARINAIDEALHAARAEDVSDEEFAEAVKTIGRKYGGAAAYDRLTPETAAVALEFALEAVRSQKSSKPATPAVQPQPRAAVIQGSKSTGKPTKPIPRWVAEKREATPEELWSETLEDFGLDRARAAQLLKNGHVTVRGT